MNVTSILLSSMIFFIVSNFGVWVLGYPHTFDGLMLCYTMAIPFFGYSIIGDLESTYENTFYALTVFLIALFLHFYFILRRLST